MPKKFRRRSMTFLYSFWVFLCILVTFVITGVFSGLLYRMGVFSMGRPPSPSGLLLVFALASLFIGTVIAAAVSRVSLGPSRKLIAAINELARGNFNVRVDLNGPWNPYEFEELTTSFNHMAQELGSTEMLRSDFINNFSHEFKTPIVSLRGFAKLLKNNRLSEEEREEYVDIIIQESDRLAMLATNVLNLSKIENQAIVAQEKEFDLAEQIRRTVLLFESKWKAKGLDLTVRLEDMAYYGNADLIGQIWVNLLDNGVKFSNPGGKLEIQLLDFYGVAVVKIRDEGCGMDENTRRHMFDKFYQGDTSHATQGNGLGMAIVQKILNLYQGQISVESTLGQGTVVTVALPKRQARENKLEGEAPLRI